MQNLITEFPKQLSDAINAKDQIDTLATEKFIGINKIAISGMGGSAFASHIIKAITNQNCNIPIILIQGYEVPQWIDKHTLFIACSYSGNTEETLTLTKTAIKKTKNNFFITTGGELYQMSEKFDIPKYSFSGDSKCPRAGIAYPLVAILLLLEKLNLLTNFEKVEALVKNTIDNLLANQEQIKKQAKDVASFLKDKFTIIYSSDFLAPTSLRFCQQLAENSEQLAHFNVIPEMNHNEIMGWNKPDFIFESIAVVIIKSSFDNEFNKKRLKITQDIIGSKSQLIEIGAKGDSKLSQLLYLVHFIDWVSLDLAFLNGVNPSEIKNIDYLKNELSK